VAPTCSARLAPAPAGPAPSKFAAATIDLGLDLGGAFTDDLDALSFSEAIGAFAASDYDFSVDPAPANGGVTVGAPILPACAPFVPNVTSSAAALEAQADLYTTAGVPPGCNVLPATCGVAGVLPCDEATFALIAPNAGPVPPPLDNLDAVAEPILPAGPCTYSGGVSSTTCPVFSVEAGSAVLVPGVAPPDGLSGLAVNEATILVPPGTPANPPNLPAGCPAGVGAPPCGAVHSTTLGLLFGGNDIDALCWFDMDGDFVPDPPAQVFLGGDLYLFSLTPASAYVAGGLFSAADILAVAPGVPRVVAASTSLGLLATDDIDGLICHQADSDGDGVLDAFDTENDADLDGYTDAVENGAILCLNAVSDDTFEDGLVNDGCPAWAGAAEVACGDMIDSDGDGRVNDGCMSFFGFGEGFFDIGTSIRGPCSVGAGPDPSPSWPPDFVSGGAFGSTDSVEIDDLVSFLVPTRYLDSSPFDPVFSTRWDLIPGPGVFGDWINISDLSAMIAGPTGSPLMPPYFGARALDGLDCLGP